MKAPTGDLGEVLEFMRLLWAVDHRLQSRSKRMRGQLGVTGTQRLVLRVVGKFPGATPKELSEILHLDKSTLTGVLQRLEEANHLKRKPHPEDARSARLYLTERGRKLDVARTRTVEVAVRRALSRASPADLKATARVLTFLDEELARPE